jgi:hypothetical protein
MEAAAWWLERCHPEHFATNKREIRELMREVRKLTADMTGAEKRSG